jgi:hypothetical protein
MKTEIGQTRKCLWRALIRETPFSRGLIFSWFLPLHSALSHYYNSRPPPPLSRPPTTAHHPLSMLPGAHVPRGHSFRDALLPHGLLLPSQGGNLGERRPGASSPPLSRGAGGDSQQSQPPPPRLHPRAINKPWQRPPAKLQPIPLRL